MPQSKGNVKEFVRNRTVTLCSDSRRSLISEDAARKNDSSEKLDFDGQGEDRSIAFGHIRQRLMVVAFTDRKGVIRIISARKANEREKKKFEIEIAHRLEENRRDEG